MCDLPRSIRGSHRVERGLQSSASQRNSLLIRHRAQTCLAPGPVPATKDAMKKKNCWLRGAGDPEWEEELEMHRSHHDVGRALTGPLRE